MDHKITIIGIGDDGFEGLTRHALELIHSAGTLFGPANLLAKLEPGKQTIVPLSADLAQVAASIDAAQTPPLVLMASIGQASTAEEAGLHFTARITKPVHIAELHHATQTALEDRALPSFRDLLLAMPQDDGELERIDIEPGPVEL